MVCVFAVSFLSAYRYNHLRSKLKLDQQPSKTQQRVIRKKIEDRIYHSIPCNNQNNFKNKIDKLDNTIIVSLIYQPETEIYFRVISSVWYSSVPSICLVCILRVPGVQSRNNFHYIRQLFPNNRRQFQSLRLAGQYNKLLRHNQQRH